MKNILLISVFVWSLCSAALPDAGAAEMEKLNVLEMQEIPAGLYDVQLQYEGRNETVKLSITNNKATFVKGFSAIRLEGLSGEFQLIGNGVFLARLGSKAGRSSQWWIFRPDGSATIKEIPDRGEKQTAKPTSDK